MGYHLKYKGPEIDERLDLAGTALQEHQDISHLASKEDVTSGLNNKVDKVEGKGLSTEDFTTEEKQKLAALDTTIKQAVDELQVEVAKKQDSIDDLEEIREGARKGATAIQEHQDISNLATKSEVSKGLSTKVDKVNGKGLSTEDFTSALKTKLESLSNYNDTELSNAIESLQTQFDTLVSGNPSEAINSFNEIIAFLDGVKDTQDLGGIIASIETQIASVSANIPTKVSQLENDKGYIDEHQDISHLATIKDVDTAIAEMYALIGTHNKEVRFFCIEPVTVKVGEAEYYCEANQVATVFIGDSEFEIIPTSNRSIQSLLAYPIPLKWYDWLEGVEVFDGIVFDMNELDTYYHWIQYYQDDFHVQKAQYSNCVFWSDKPYTHSPFEQRTNYTIYYSSQLPLCYSRIPENTYKPFYLAYGVNSDPNWRNPDYINSYSIVSGATQTFSYYGASAIGIFDMAVHVIPLPKDCRGLMYHAPAIQHAGVFDASKTTNFGAKKGSWQDAFGDCISLTSLYIQNLKASINLSWSPINTKSLAYIVNNAINTSKITISLSPYTWYRLTDKIRATATSKNITLELITTNYVDDSRWATKQNTIEDLDAIRNGASLGATALQAVPSEYITETTLNNKGYLTSVPDEYVTETELNGKGYATTSELTSGLNSKASVAQVESMIAEAITNTLNTEV